jgi:SAM-dependent methyltransferase
MRQGRERAAGESWRGAWGGAAGEGVLDPPIPHATRPMGRSSVAWHDAECGAYSTDLALWEELTDDADGEVLDLGCGTGRVGLHLARKGHRVTGLDADAALLAAFREKAGGRPVEVELGDARWFELGREFELVLAPMQLVQLFAGAEERVECLRCVAGHLGPGGIAALAIVEEVRAAEVGGALLPDVREVDGWVYSSLPIETGVDADSIVVRRLRQAVSPKGEMSEEVDEIRLQRLSAETLEREAVEAGLAPVGRREIPATDAHVGSTAVLLERGA